MLNMRRRCCGPEEVVAIPTETEGVRSGCEYLDGVVPNIFTIKELAEFLESRAIVHIAERDPCYVCRGRSCPKERKNCMMACLLAGSTHAGSSKRSRVLDLVTSGLDSVAVRMPHIP